MTWHSRCPQRGTVHRTPPRHPVCYFPSLCWLMATKSRPGVDERPLGVTPLGVTPLGETPLGVTPFLPIPLGVTPFLSMPASAGTVHTKTLALKTSPNKMIAFFIFPSFASYRVCYPLSYPLHR